MSRDEFLELIVSRADDVTKVGEVMRFVESVFKLQNDMSRPVYIFEVDQDSMTSEDLALLDMSMNSIGIACVLVPKGIIGYVGEVTSESYGQQNIRTELLGVRPRGRQL